MTSNMTKGNPVKLILSFMLPLFLGNTFQQLYSMADTIIVGRTISVEALAAVGATGAISFLVIGFVQGVTSGFAVITAQRFGAGDENGVRRSVATSIVLSLSITAIITFVSVLFARPMLDVMKTPPDITDMSYEYIKVIFIGTASAVFFNLFSSILRSLGDSKTPLIFLIIASIINIVLDFIFILIFKMGVAGAGWATIIAQFISGMLCFIYSLKKFPILHLAKKDWILSYRFAWQHFAVGLPMAFQFSITAIGTMLIQASLNSLGSTAVAAFTAGSKIDQLVSLPTVSLGVAVATYCAQNYGARRMDRIKRGVNKSAIIATIFSIIGGIIVIVLSKPLICLFIDSSENEVISLSQKYLFINGVSYTAFGLLFVYRNALQGIGQSMVTFFGGVWELVMRSLVAFCLVSRLEFTAICIASPIAWLGATIWLIAVYYIIIAKNKCLCQP